MVKRRSASNRQALPRTYGRRTRRTLRKLVTVMCPHDGIYDQPVTKDVLAAVLRFVPFLPVPMRYGLPPALTIFDAAPPLFGFGFRRFHQLDADAAARYLERWEHGVWPLPLLYSGLHAMILVTFYQHPSVLAALDVDWERRSRDLVALRARLTGDVAQTAPSELEGREAG